jgi:uncharacterized protein
MRDKPQRADLFPTDEPVASDQMIGRGTDVERLAQALEAGQSLRILAPRRTGKTTVCDAALERLRGQGWYTASIDLMYATGAAGLAQVITRAMIANRPLVHRALAGVPDAWEKLSDVVRAQMTVDLGEGVSIAFGLSGAQEDPEAALSAALELPQRIAEKDGRPVALLFDELQELAAPAAPFGDPDRLQARMRAILQRSPQVGVLFAGSREHAMRRVFQPDAPLGGFGGSFALSPITPEEWRAGLAARFGRARVGADDALLAQLVDLGDGHPRATMLIAAEAYTVTRELEAAALEPATVALAWERARAHDAERCRLLIERMRRLRVARGTDLALRVARSVAAGGAPYSVGAHAEQVRRVLDELSDIGAVDQRSARTWHVPDPILRAYLA